MSFSDFLSFQSEALARSAECVVHDVCKVKSGERVLIVTNPSADVARISAALYDSLQRVGAKPVMVVQGEKTLLDFADEAVVAALKTEPEVIFSLSAEKLGKDREALANPYKKDGKSFTSAFDWLLDGKKVSRAIWTPGITEEIFCRSVCVDYAQMAQRCKAISGILTDADFVEITAPAGTNLRLSVKGRAAFSDDGDFSFAGAGGNIPAGEVFVSPAIGTCEGKIVYDGSIALDAGTLKIERPIECVLEGGYISKITGDEEAEKLRATIDAAQKGAVEFERQGRLAKGDGAVYAKNATHIGELGIGLNPAAIISGNMLEDEKAFRTCHFAIGSNYDNDAESLIHLDGVVKNPTITAIMPDGSRKVIEKDGEMAL